MRDTDAVAAAGSGVPPALQPGSAAGSCDRPLLPGGAAQSPQAHTDDRECDRPRGAEHERTEQ